VSVNYNVKEQFEKPVFTLDVTITNETLHTVTTKTCTSYNGTGVGSGMSIIEHGVLSGFEVDTKDVTANVDIKKIEIDDKMINIYLDEVSFLVKLMCRQSRKGNYLQHGHPAKRTHKK
ncbi:hypothetical protein FSP39_019425, partial [Pinctada imbricata]